MTSPETKAERNARILEGFILDGEAACGQLMAKAKAKLEADDTEAAGRLHARWCRLTRRVMQAMVLDDKLDRMAAEAKDKAEAREARTPQPNPEASRRRADILAAFRIDGLGLDQETELKELLDELEDDELLAYSVPRNLHRIAEHLNWAPPTALVEEAQRIVAERQARVPPPQGEVARSAGRGPPERLQQPAAQAPEMTPSSPNGGATGPAPARPVRLVPPPEPLSEEQREQQVRARALRQRQARDEANRDFENSS